MNKLLTVFAIIPTYIACIMLNRADLPRDSRDVRDTTSCPEQTRAFPMDGTFKLSDGLLS